MTTHKLHPRGPGGMATLRALGMSSGEATVQILGSSGGEASNGISSGGEAKASGSRFSVLLPCRQGPA